MTGNILAIIQISSYYPVMESNVDKAIKFFSGGFNCSQAMFAAYAPLFGLETDTALKIACGFGGGMGSLQNTCGAVTGAFMVIGLVFGKWKPEDNESKTKTYSLVREFAAEFEKINKTINCRELIGCDISTPEGSAKAREEGLFETKCKKYIKDAALIIERLIATLPDTV
ncbi:MAG: C_GCAxxG_C_C family protein [Spirochaetales bacterium]|nr:C_GCAxxG_C_C family protein [Spirochaetales bacterium]